MPRAAVSRELLANQRQPELPPLDPGLEADIKLGERTAFIPMTCQEKLVLDRLENGLVEAAALWKNQPQQQDHDNLLGSALQHWRLGLGGVDTSWVWEVGRWNCQFTLPFAAELRRIEPTVVSECDQLVALSTCLRNRQLQLAMRMQQQQQEQQQQLQQEQQQQLQQQQQQQQPTTKEGGKRASKKQKQASPEDLEDDPCLCQIRWGLAPDSEAAKRRQLEKVEQEKLLEQAAAGRSALLQQQKQQQQQQPKQQKQLKQPKQLPQAAAGPRRAIVKTSHLRDEQQPPPPPPPFDVFHDDELSSGYGSKDSSPRQCLSERSVGHINDLLTCGLVGRWGAD